MLAKRICSYCKSLLGYKEVAGNHNETHGMCEICKAKAFDEIREYKKGLNNEK